MKLLVTTLLLLISCSSKPSEQPQIAYDFNQTTQELKIRVKLPAGLHAYGLGEKIGRPIGLEIGSESNWRLVGQPNLPVGDQKHLLSKEFQVTAKLTGGAGPVSGVFKMQLCSDNSCGRPQDYAFKIPL